jgi:hypothetical protein
MVEHHVVADLRRLADDDAGAVVYEETLADARSWMDLDAARQYAGDLREQARYEGHTRDIQAMRDAMDEQRPESLVEQHFEDTARGGVFLEDYIYVVGPARAFARYGGRRRWPLPVVIGVVPCAHVGQRGFSLAMAVVGAARVFGCDTLCHSLRLHHSPARDARNGSPNEV